MGAATMHASPERVTPAQVAALARRHGRQAHCPACAHFKAPGWTSLAASTDVSALQCLGALWLPGDDEPTLEEARPAGMDPWSVEVPISLAYHPNNRCQVWACRHCVKPFLRYTEYGGYYIDHRFRELNPERLTDL
jgi:hypothetical protein